MTAPRLDWADPSAVQAWGDDVRALVNDLAAAGEDATRAPGERELGRRAARRLVLEASRGLAASLAFAGIAAPVGEAGEAGEDAPPASGPRDSDRRALR